jgi:transcriptional regulator with XRE-family HTH domain
MVPLLEVDNTLRALGARVRKGRIAQNEPMSVFAERIGVSVPTLRDIELGRRSVSVSHWVAALWALGAIRDLDKVLPPQESLFDRYRPTGRERSRPYRRTKRAL